MVAGLQEKDGYKSGPPWVFKGRALYQLHLVPVKAARRFIPPDLKIVSAFGYTLGGVYYARYDDSPAGKFDEASCLHALVALAGIVWNPPTSCAWASKVYVSSRSAEQHGLEDVGLPSRFASFKEDQSGFVELTDVAGNARRAVCRIANPFRQKGNNSANQPNWTKGPPIRMSLPSFRVKLVPSSRVECNYTNHSNNITRDTSDDTHAALEAVLTGKPVLSLLFDDMVMSVAAPIAVTRESEKKAKQPLLAQKSSTTLAAGTS
eukprot:jgi/Chlat1/9140/Chrsp97S08393